MTNPLPIEAALLVCCAADVEQLCVIGRRQPRPFLVIKLRPAALASSIATDAAKVAIAANVAAVNKTSPGITRPARLSAAHASSAVALSPVRGQAARSQMAAH
jgi:hypothetical protein